MKAQTVERLLGMMGLLFVGVWITTSLDRVVFSHLAIDEIKHSSDSANPQKASALPIDFGQWSKQRIAAYEASLTRKCDEPIAILQIPKIRLEAPVFPRTNDLTLNRGLGVIGPGTLGQNIGIAGHRDGFFRGLQRVELHDLIRLVWPGRVDLYEVTEIRIVSPNDVGVLDPTSTPSITLVTCFPFYFIGHAPKRYIVTAQMQQSRADKVQKKTCVAGATSQSASYSWTDALTCAPAR